jgi:hypothetical protein
MAAASTLPEAARVALDPSGPLDAPTLPPRLPRLCGLGYD